MSTLSERMIQDMQLKGLSPRTQRSYVRAIRQLAQHYHEEILRNTGDSHEWRFLKPNIPFFHDY